MPDEILGLKRSFLRLRLTYETSMDSADIEKAVKENAQHVKADANGVDMDALDRLVAVIGGTRNGACASSYDPVAAGKAMGKRDDSKPNSLAFR
jgi:hypothetical protein